MLTWNALLWQEVKATSRAEAARKLGISRTSVSLLLANKYPGGTANMARRINTILAPAMKHVCPHTGEEITIMDCAKNSARMPTSGPAALRLWKVCKACAHNPHKENES